MACRWLRLDRLRLSRRAHTLRMALDQFAVRHRRYVRLSQRQLLLLQSLVGVGAGAASASALELGSARRRTNLCMGALQLRLSGTFLERHEPGFSEGRATHAS